MPGSAGLVLSVHMQHCSTAHVCLLGGPSSPAMEQNSSQTLDKNIISWPYIYTQGYLLEPLFPSCFEQQQLLKGLFFSPRHNHLGSSGRDLYIHLSIHHSVLTGTTKKTINKSEDKANVVLCL